MKNIISLKLFIIPFLQLINLYKINKNVRKNIIIPVGLVKKINPNVNPDKPEYKLNFLLSIYHFVKNKKPSELNDVSDKSIR